MKVTPLFRIDTIEVLPTSRTVIRNGLHVQAEPRVFDLLILLAENGEAITSKDEIVQRVWNGRAISDDAISSAIRDLRSLLGDDGRRQELIKTIYGCGFRLAKPVVRFPDKKTLAVSNPSDIGTSFAELQQDGLQTRQSIAVLPLTPLQDEDETMCKAASLDLTIALARTRWLFVSSYASSSRMQTGQLPNLDIARRLGVRYLLSGSLAHDARTVRLSLVLTDTNENSDVWGTTITRPLDDTCLALEEIARTVAAGIETEIEHRERRRALLAPMASLDAWGAYHKAMALLLQFSSEFYDPAERLLERAAALDPSGSRIRAALSFLEWQRAFLEQGTARNHAQAKAKEYAKESISLDPSDPQGHWALGRTHIIDCQVAQAEASLSRAVELNPSYANAYYSMAWSLSQEPSRRDDSLRIVRQALRLSPEDPMIYGCHILEADLGYFRGDYDKAITSALKAASHPWAHHHVLAIASWVLQASGASKDAHRLAEEVRRRKPGYDFNDYCGAVPVQGEKKTMVEGIFAELGY